MIAVAQMGPVPVTIVLGLLTTFLLAPAERGRAALVIGTASFLGAVGFGSLHAGSVLALHASDLGGYVVARRAARLAATIFLVSGATVYLIKLHGPGLYTSGVLSQVLVGAGLTVLVLFQSRTLQGLGHTTNYRRLIFRQLILYAGGCLVLLIVLSKRVSSAVTVPWLLASATAAVLGHQLLRRAVHRLGLPNTKPSTSAVKASLAVHSSAIAQQLVFRVDVTLIGLLAASADLGYYTVAVSLAETVWIIPEVLALAVFADAAVRRSLKWQEIVGLRLKQALVISALVSIIVVSAGGVLLLGVMPAYRDAYPLLLILVPGMVASAGTRILLSAFSARDIRRSLLLTGGGTVLLTPIYVPAISMLGVRGAALSSSLIYLCQFVFVYLVSRSAAPFSCRDTIGSEAMPLSFDPRASTSPGA